MNMQLSTLVLVGSEAHKQAVLASGVDTVEIMDTELGGEQVITRNDKLFCSRFSMNEDR